MALETRPDGTNANWHRSTVCFSFRNEYFGTAYGHKCIEQLPVLLDSQHEKNRFDRGDDFIKMRTRIEKLTLRLYFGWRC